MSRAADLAAPVGLVRVSDSLAAGARRIVREGLTGLAVISDSGHPLAVLPASQVLGQAIPQYIKDDPALARVVDEASADRLVERLDALTVQQVLEDAEPDLLGTVPHDATLLEVAVEMSRLGLGMLVVTGPDGVALGTVTVQALLRASLSPA